MKKKLLLLIILLNTYVNAQCGIEKTIEICDISLVKDGLINLHEEYKNIAGGVEIQKGEWSENILSNRSIKDKKKGIINIWNLPESSLGRSGVYLYKLKNKDCPDIALTINLKIGAFSGKNIKTEDNTITVCYTKEQQYCMGEQKYDLSETLQSTPVAHKNGEWEYKGKVGNNGTFIKRDGHIFKAKVPYVPYGDKTEKEIFKFRYTVLSDLKCNPKSETNVRVEVIRAISAGYGSSKIICERDITTTSNYNDDINLRDDYYLRLEDVEGYWEHKGKLSSTSDKASINIKNIYATLKAKNPRFRNKIYGYKYKVEANSLQCGNDEALVKFIIVEDLKKFRPIEGRESINICTNSEEIKQIDLYENLKFTEENGVIYDYAANNNSSYWKVSPQFTGKILKEFLHLNPDWKYNVKTEKLTCSIPKTKIDLSFLKKNEIKKYIFTYTVPSTYNYKPLKPTEAEKKARGCKWKGYKKTCNDDVSASIKIVLIDTNNYLGDNTNKVLCEGSFTPTINLNDLLQKDPNKKFDENGVWQNADNETIVGNNFYFPTFNGDSKTIKLKYINPKNICNKNNTTLNLTVHKNNAGGTRKTINICPSENSFDLFSKLDNASTNGKWTDPELNVSLNHKLIINPKKAKPGFYVYQTPNVNGENGELICEGKSCIIKLSLIESYAGEDTFDITFCENYFKDNSIDLYDIIQRNTDKEITRGGVWINLETKKPINHIFKYLPFTENKKTFKLKHTTPDINGCNDTALLSFTIYKAPNAGKGINKTICSKDGKFKLFTLLKGTPSSNGYWTLPDKTTKGNEFILEPGNAKEGDYIYTSNAVKDNGDVKCPKQESVVSLKINHIYAGENTTALNICESELEKGLNLSSLLEKDKEKTFSDEGTWKNTKTNSVVNSIFTTRITKDTEFNLEYTVSEKGCQDRSTLNFKVLKQSAGKGKILALCNTDTSIKNLFNELKGTPLNTGIWIKPDGTKTSDENLNIQGNKTNPGNYIYEIAARKDNSGNIICPKQQTTITVKIEEVPNAGDNTSTTICINNGIIDLTTLLRNNNSTIGNFYNSDNIEIPREFNPKNIKEKTTIIFKIKDRACKGDQASITLIPKSSIAPIAKDQEFCPSKKTPKVSDLIVSGSSNYQWYDNDDSKDELPTDTKLKDGATYFVENTDLNNGCKSTRTKIFVKFTTIGEIGCEPCIADGITANDDNKNDSLELCNLPELFPKYTLEIYNRFGVKVFKGDKSKELFSGDSNIPNVMGGKKLPTGVYFYIFNPNDNKTKSIESDFYLGR